MLEQLAKIIVVTGHYGSGKTNFSVNLALALREAGRRVTLVDLDLVNPYFRSADFVELTHEKDIGLVMPTFAGTNLDVPSVSGRLDGLLDEDRTVLIDVGGDDAGATALGRYAAHIQELGGYDFLYVVNCYRYLTQTPKEALTLLSEIERASRLRATGIVNCSNLAHETDTGIVLESLEYAQTCAQRSGLPLVTTAVARPLVPELCAAKPGQTFFPVEIYVKKPWEE